MITVDEQIIRNVLSKRKELEADLKKRRSFLVKTYRTLEQDIYESSVLSSVSLQEGTAIGNRSKYDLGDLSLRIVEQTRKQQRVIQEEFSVIEEQLQMIQRIWCCYNALPLHLKNLLEKLYVEQQKWSVCGSSPRKISQEKKEGIAKIMAWCNSDMTEIEIIMQGQKENFL